MKGQFYSKIFLQFHGRRPAIIGISLASVDDHTVDRDGLNDLDRAIIYARMEESQAATASLKSKNRGPSKGVHITKPMHLVYNEFGVRSPRWRVVGGIWKISWLMCY